MKNYARTNLDLVDLLLHWFSTLRLDGFGCGKRNNEGIKQRKGNLPWRLGIPRAFLLADVLGFLRGSSGACETGG